MVFIDTGAFLARYILNDQYHKKAVTLWKKLEQKNKNCFTSNFVLYEMFTLLARKTTYDFAAERAGHVFESERLLILRPLESDEYEALSLFKKYADQGVSFTACVSFVLMRKQKLSHVFSFDKHFELAGFKILR